MVVTYSGLRHPTVTCIDPIVYVDINNVVDPFVASYLWLSITNQEGATTYYKIYSGSGNLAGHTFTTQKLGSIANATVDVKVFTGSSRTLPASGSIPNGYYLSEDINLTVEAYSDSGYTASLGSVDFVLTYRFIDRLNAAWTVVTSDNFDDGTTGSWNTVQTAGSTNWLTVSNSVYRSAPYSLNVDSESGDVPYPNSNMWKQYANPSATGSAFWIASVMTAHVKTAIPSSNMTSAVRFEIDDVTKYKFQFYNPLVWYQAVIPVATGSTNKIAIRQSADSIYGPSIWFDDVYYIKN